MSVLSSIAAEEFNTIRDEWEKNLKAELKLPEIGGKASKKSIDGGIWPTLSLDRARAIQLPVKEAWKKASQTYISIGKEIESELHEDLTHGVRNFFFHKERLSAEKWKLISSVLSTYSEPEDLDVFLLGKENFEAGKFSFKVINDTQIFSGRMSHDEGGTIVEELGLLTTQLIERLGESGPVIYLGIFSDPQFFRNIAKMRAAKLLALKVLEESKIKKEIKLVSLTSYREWTMFEQYSNILRNDSAVASSYIGCADHVQSAGYHSLFEFTSSSVSEHHERSLRMARNTAHILALESMLGVVHDPSYGSYHLETLTLKYAEDSWKEMQTLLKLSVHERIKYVVEGAAKVRTERLKDIRTRKHVMAGTNDFPDAKEELKLTSLPELPFFRVAQGFESLRLKMENLKPKPEVFLGIFGDYAALNARVNFVKNYFQLLGLTVHEVLDQATFEKKEGIAVLCASDEDYPKLANLSPKSVDKFIAGKFEMTGFMNLSAGQDVYSVLEGLVSRWGNK